MLINVNPYAKPRYFSNIFDLWVMVIDLSLSDANFPSYSHTDNLLRMDGLNVSQAAEALLSVFPLDSFVPEPVLRMEIDGKPDEINEVQQDLIHTVNKISGPNWKVGSMERQQFYNEAKETFAVITTSDTRPYGCFIFTKGVLKPDGTVWII